MKYIKYYFDQTFSELLSRNDGDNELTILHFFNENGEEDGTSALLFYCCTIEEEIEVEVECGLYFLTICQR